jgi:hypothetical protein
MAIRRNQTNTVDTQTRGLRKGAKVVTARAQQTANATGLSQEGIEELIRLKAYSLYQERGASDGGHEQDWDTAERLVKQELNLG